MSAIGQGAPGLRSNLRRFRDLLDDSAAKKAVLVQLRLGQLVTGWSAYDTDTYTAPLSFSFDGVRRDVVGVSSDAVASLTRVESIALCVSTPYSYYYNPDDTDSGARWDDGSTVFDGGVVKWDEYPKLYANFGGDTNPATGGDAVGVRFAFHFGSEALTHPDLGPDKLTNGDFESWASASDANSWTEAASGTGYAVARGSVVPASGSYSLELQYGAGVGYAQVTQGSLALISGAIYRLCGDYQTPVSAGATVEPMIKIYSGSDYVASDGRTKVAANQITLDRTGGEWRRFMFDFVAPFTTATVLLGVNDSTGSGATGSAYFDNVQLMRVWRYQWHDPRVSASSVPATESGSNDIYFGGKRIGSGNVSINNSDGMIERLLGQLDVLGQEIRIDFGGALSGDDQELPRDDYRRAFTGEVRGIESTDSAVLFQLQDTRAFFHVKLPPRTYTDDGYVESRSIGKVRPLWFGAKENITPVRISDEVYELADCESSPAGIKSIDAVYAYTDEAAAKDQDTALRRSIALGAEVAPVLTWALKGTATYPAGTTFTRDSSSGWDSGFRSVARLYGDGYVRCTNAPNTGARFIGLESSETHTVTSYTTMDYAIYLQGSGNWTIYESGTQPSSGSGIGATDLVRVRRGGTTIYYEKSTDGGANWTNLYTSATATSAVLHVAGQIYTADLALSDIWIYGFSDVTQDLPNGQFTINTDMGPYVVTADNKFFNFHIGGSELTATLTEGLYSAHELAMHLGDKMRTATGAAFSDLTAVYSDSTHKFTLAKGAGTLTLKITTGTNKDAGGWSLIGFSRSADKSGSLSYESDDATYETPDSRIIRVDGKGYKDDASGTYTGTANALIEVGADILRVLFVKYLKKDAALVDETSFQSARDRAPESLCLYLNTSTTTKDVFDRLEYSNISNIVVDGAGSISCNVYIGTVDASITDFMDHDFLSFKASEAITEVYRTVRVYYDQDPSTNAWEGASDSEPETSVRFRRENYREFQTYIKYGSNAEAAASRMLELAKAPARKITFAAKGKLADKRVGDKVRLTRTRSLDPNGRLSSQVVRIISLKHNYLTGVSEAEAVDDVVTVAGAACITACQSLCEQTCMTGCQSSCMASCELSCMTGCESSCMAGCEGSCMTTCEVSCMTTCEQTCQDACMSSCQDVCESVAQTGCGVSCQTGCEVSCMDGCESTCMTGCEVSCMTGCEVSCMSGCEVSCMTGCEVSCMTGCEVSCMTSCEVSCMTSCEVSCMTECQSFCQTPREQGA